MQKHWLNGEGERRKSVSTKSSSPPPPTATSLAYSLCVSLRGSMENGRFFFVFVCVLKKSKERQKFQGCPKWWKEPPSFIRPVAWKKKLDYRFRCSWRRKASSPRFFPKNKEQHRHIILTGASPSFFFVCRWLLLRCRRLLQLYSSSQSLAGGIWFWAQGDVLREHIPPFQFVAPSSLILFYSPFRLRRKGGDKRNKKENFFPPSIWRPSLPYFIFAWFNFDQMIDHWFSTKHWNPPFFIEIFFKNFFFQFVFFSSHSNELDDFGFTKCRCTSWIWMPGNTVWNI